MLAGTLADPAATAPFLGHPIWQEAFAWIARATPDHPEGIFELRGRDMFVNVHSYETLAREACFYESHRKYVDLQFCIAGAERIEWTPISQLAVDVPYDAEADLLKWRAPETAGSLRMTPGTFCIFYPEDAHMPKLRDAAAARTKKLVVKTRIDLLG